jgi:hypothetical protein
MSGEFQAVRNRDYKYRMIISEKSPFNPAGAGAPYGAKPSLYQIGRSDEAHDVSLKHPRIAATLAEKLEAFRAETESNPRGWLPMSDQR